MPESLDNVNLDTIRALRKKLLDTRIELKKLREELITVREAIRDAIDRIDAATGRT